MEATEIKQRIAIRETDYQIERQRLSGRLPKLNAVFHASQALSIRSIVSMDELFKLIVDSDSWVRDALMESFDPNIGGVTISPDSIRANLQIPAGIHNVNFHINLLMKSEYSMPLKADLKWYAIDGNKIILKEEELKEHFSVYADCAEDLERLKYLEKLQALYDTMKSSQLWPSELFTSNIQQWFINGSINHRYVHKDPVLGWPLYFKVR